MPNTQFSNDSNSQKIQPAAILHNSNNANTLHLVSNESTESPVGPINEADARDVISLHGRPHLLNIH